jgi:hypothetical protein
MSLRPYVALALLLTTPAFAAARKPAAPAPATSQAKVTDTAIDPAEQDGARKAAEAYLQACSRAGDQMAIDTLLGGATLMARAFVIDGWKITGREKHRHETGKLESLHAFVDALDASGRKSLMQLLGGGPAAEPDLQEVTAEEATQILKPTRVRTRDFAKSHPVFAYLARVDKPVYWHPNNPFRKLLAAAGPEGDYQVDLDLFWVESTRNGSTRRWPLRVVRFVANGQDTGLRILPASDWNAE